MKDSVWVETQYRNKQSGIVYCVTVKYTVYNIYKFGVKSISCSVMRLIFSTGYSNT